MAAARPASVPLRILSGLCGARHAACAIAMLGLGCAQASPEQDYMLHCMGCHGTWAQGVPGKVPPLANAIGRFMRSAEGRDYVLRVPGAANSALTDSQLAAVLNWIAATYDANEPSSTARPFTVGEVTRVRHSPLPSVLAARQSVVRSLAAGGAAPPGQY